MVHYAGVQQKGAALNFVTHSGYVLFLLCTFMYFAIDFI